MITLTNKPGKFYVKSESLEDRYDNWHPDLQRICLSQFAKRLTKKSKPKLEDEDMLFESGTYVLISEENDHNDKLQHSNTNEIKDDFIIDFHK